MGENVWDESISLKWFMVTMVVLIVVALVFGGLWMSSSYDYITLKQEYVALQSKYQTLLTQYEILESNSTLVQAYNQLKAKYNSLINEFGEAESYTASTFFGVDIAPGGYLLYPIVVPSTCIATVYIGVDTLSTVDVYVTTLSSMNDAFRTLIKAPAILYEWQPNLLGIVNENVTLKPGVYIVGILNPVTSQETASVDVQITTTLQCK